MDQVALYTQSQAQREARAAVMRRSTQTACPIVDSDPELELDHIECVRCSTRLVGVYVRVRDGLCRNCQREANGGNE